MPHAVSRRANGTLSHRQSTVRGNADEGTASQDRRTRRPRWLPGRFPGIARDRIPTGAGIYLGRRDARRDDRVAFASFEDVFAAATRQYAKKQMQRFRRDAEFAFISVHIWSTIRIQGWRMPPRSQRTSAKCDSNYHMGS